MGKNNIRLGAIYMFISVTGFAVMDLAVKWTTEDYSIGYVVFWRMLGGLIPLIFTIPKDRWAHLLSTSKPGWHLTRAFAGTTALFFVYASLHYLPLATTVSLTFASPIFSTLLSIFVLGEVVKGRRWTAIIIGFIGVLIIINPTSSEFNVFMIFPIVFCIFFSIVAITIRKLTETEPTYLIALYFTIFAMIASLFTIPFGGWYWWPLSTFDFLMLALVGISGGIGNLALTQGLKNADVSTMTPLKYLSLIYGIIFGYLIWNEIPAWNTYVGALFIIASSLIILRREKVLKKETNPDKYIIRR
jgi:drug/metabolite transporter (DMT)-like permease